MSSSADLVLKNISWVVEGVDPTHDGPGRGFEPVDLTVADPEALPLPRAYSVMWRGEEPADPSFSDATERVAEHRYSVEVYYPHEYPLDYRQEIALCDRHDLLKALRDDENFFGWEAAHASDDIGLWARSVEGVELVDEMEHTATLRIDLRCTIREEE